MTLERDHDDPILQLLDGLAEATAMLDADGTVLVANEACAGRLGRARHEILGRRIDDLLPANAHRRRPFVAAARSGVSVRFRDERDGRWLEQRVVPLRDGDGAVYRFAVYCADVTEQRTGEREHAARSAELEAIHAHSPVAVLILDPERNITQANAAAARMTGRGRAEVIG
ncbi:PAS domain-containing protein, partial [bacterium]|nr:PAS domain-containing protein [bacterium]